jgi:AcrR family transcriptional regulator
MATASAERPEGEKRRPGRPRLDGPSPEYLALQSEIIDQAAKVFRKRGYAGVPLDDVAEALGLRKASLYYYVKTKDHLLYLVFDRAISSALERLEQIAAAGLSPRERLEALIRHQVATVAEDLEEFTVFFDQHYHLDDKSKVEMQKKERRYLRLNAEMVSAAIEDGALPAVDPTYAAQAILGMTSWVYKWFDPERHDPDAFADVVVALLLGSRPQARQPARKRSSAPAVKGRASKRSSA